MDLVNKAELHLEIEGPSPADLEMVEETVGKLERSSDPAERKVAQSFRKLMRDNDRALKMLERRRGR